MTDPEQLSFLLPPERPGTIGRLADYDIVRILGEGGMGIVLEGLDRHLLRPVAIKVIQPRQVTAGLKERFLREARAAAGLRHESIVTIYQVGEFNGMPFLTMEYLEGHSLDKLLVKGQPHALAEAVRIGRETAEGLVVAHAKNIIHRDLKPANIWVQRRGRCKLLDFGIARIATDGRGLTSTGAILGTPAYMSPEQARGERVGPRADLFSLGAVLYELTTGRLPFPGNDLIAILMALASTEPTPPRQLNPAIPPALSRLIIQLLKKNAELRPASAEQVVDELAAIEAKLPKRVPEKVPIDGSGSRLSIQSLMRRLAGPFGCRIESEQSTFPESVIDTFKTTPNTPLINEPAALPEIDEKLSAIVENSDPGDIAVVDVKAALEFVQPTSAVLPAVAAESGRPAALIRFLRSYSRAITAAGVLLAVCVGMLYVSSLWRGMITFSQTTIDLGGSGIDIVFLSVAGCSTLAAFVLLARRSAASGIWRVNGQDASWTFAMLADFPRAAEFILRGSIALIGGTIVENSYLMPIGRNSSAFLPILGCFLVFCLLASFVWAQIGALRRQHVQVSKSSLRVGNPNTSSWSALLPGTANFGRWLMTLTLLWSVFVISLAIISFLLLMFIVYASEYDDYRGGVPPAWMRYSSLTVIFYCLFRACEAFFWIWRWRRPASLTAGSNLKFRFRRFAAILVLLLVFWTIDQVVYWNSVEYRRKAMAKPSDSRQTAKPKEIDDFPTTAAEVNLSSNKQITDSDLARLTKFTSLEELDLSWTSITDAALKNLEGLTTLKKLSLDGISIKSAGLEKLKALPALQELELAYSEITDRELEVLKTFQTLKRLGLQGNPITDAGMVHLAEMSNLVDLLLPVTKIGDDGITHLKSMKNLKSLYLSQTLVTEKGIADLQGALPECRISGLNK